MKLRKAQVKSSIFDVFNNTMAKIIELGDYDDYENTYSIKEIGTIEGDLQPYSGGLAEKDYGLVVECQYRFFCAANEDITEGRYLIVGEKAYEITYAAVWDMGLTVLLKGVELNGRRE